MIELFSLAKSFEFWKKDYLSSRLYAFYSSQSSLMMLNAHLTKMPVACILDNIFLLVDECFTDDHHVSTDDEDDDTFIDHLIPCTFRYYTKKEIVE